VSLPTSWDDVEIFWWIDWCCTDQDKLLPKKSANEPGRDARPDIAALPAYAAASAGIVAAWTPEYASRPWCRAELLLAYAFMTSGRNVLVVPAGFAGSSGHGMDGYRIVLADPRETVDTLTNPNDRPVIASLTGWRSARRPSRAGACASSTRRRACS